MRGLATLRWKGGEGSPVQEGMLSISGLLQGRSWVFFWELIDCLEVIKNEKKNRTRTQSTPLTSWW
jgi:hypothetical protein